MHIESQRPSVSLLDVKGLNVHFIVNIQLLGFDSVKDQVVVCAPPLLDKQSHPHYSGDICKFDDAFAWVGGFAVVGVEQGDQKQ